MLEDKWERVEVLELCHQTKDHISKTTQFRQSFEVTCADLSQIPLEVTCAVPNGIEGRFRVSHMECHLAVSAASFHHCRRDAQAEDFTAISQTNMLAGTHS
jgi:hypothetical protein